MSTTMNHEVNARRKLRNIKFYKKGGFKLASGEMSPYYYDVKLAIGDTDFLYDICWSIEQKISKLPSFRSVGGIETGSIPIASAFAMYYSLIHNSSPSLFYVRKDFKQHGTDRMIEGIMEPPSLLIEDVITRGTTLKSIMTTIAMNMQKIDLVIPVLFRGTKEDKQRIEQRLKVKIDPIFYEGDLND